MCRPCCVSSNSATVKRVLWLLWLLVAGAGAHAQVDAVARLDSARVEAGDTFIMHLAVPFNAGTPGKIDFSPWKNTLQEENVLRRTAWSHIGQFWMSKLTLIAFDSGTFVLPPLLIQLSGEQTAATNPVQLDVYPTPSPSDPQALLDIREIRREPSHWLDYIAWFAAAVALILALLAYWLLRRRKKRREEYLLNLPPHLLALQKLQQLEHARAWEQPGGLRPYYEELTFILREYLEKEHRLRALESTTAEILRDLRRFPLPNELPPQLETLLTQADLVKFAKGKPPHTLHEPALYAVRAFVEVTSKRTESESVREGEREMIRHES